ncbi:hypothetical protein QBC46DRAFT_108560 [Diplogelasinospora grovesii]|uniref:Uncharacterized protein n=1 Tax=Diplogelasinospora grovesii TaxID=303347 RepID=A0AAN6NCF2_9PEZI|nr:hypothetical protein QBC46DRAFT_108560 [Diplogelasinospora grovesii]
MVDLTAPRTHRRRDLLRRQPPNAVPVRRHPPVSLHGMDHVGRFKEAEGRERIGPGRVPLPLGVEVISIPNENVSSSFHSVTTYPDRWPAKTRSSRPKLAALTSYIYQSILGNRFVSLMWAWTELASVLCQLTYSRTLYKGTSASSTGRNGGRDYTPERTILRKRQMRIVKRLVEEIPAANADAARRGIAPSSSSAQENNHNSDYFKDVHIFVLPGKRLASLQVCCSFQVPCVFYTIYPFRP